MKNRFRDLISVCGVVAIVGLLVAAVSPSGGGGGGSGAPTNTLTGNLTQYRIPVASGATNLADGPFYSDANNTNAHLLGDFFADAMTSTGLVTAASANIGSGAFTASASGATNTTNMVLSGILALPSTATQTLMTNSVIQPNAAAVTVIGTNGGPVTLWGQNIANGVTGQVLEIKGSDNTATVTLMDSGTVPTSNVLLPASQLTLGKGGVLTLRWYASLTSWVGVAFSPNALKVSRWSNETVETNLAVLTLTPTNNLVGIGNGSTLVPATKSMLTNTMSLDGDTTKFINGAGNEATVPAGGLTNTWRWREFSAGEMLAGTTTAPYYPANYVQWIPSGSTLSFDAWSFFGDPTLRQTNAVELHWQPPITWDANTNNLKLMLWFANTNASLNLTSNVVWSVRSVALASGANLATDVFTGTAVTNIASFTNVTANYLMASTPIGGPLWFPSAPTTNEVVVFRLARLQDGTVDTVTNSVFLLKAVLQYNEISTGPTLW